MGKEVSEEQQPPDGTGGGRRGGGGGRGAAAAIHTFDDKALNYLDSLASKFGSPVLAMQPKDVYSQLCMVDTLEKMGISLNFSYEIRDILDMTYRCWMKNEEEVMMYMATRSKAFRLLRVHSYDITSDDLIKENIHSWSSKLLKQHLSSKKIATSVMHEVEYTLKFPIHATLERLEHRRNIEQFKAEGSRLLKLRYWLVSEALRKMDGKHLEIIGSHVTARILQICVKWCSQSERDAIFEALQPDFLILSRKKYVVFLVKKLIKLATKKQFEWFISTFYGCIAKLLHHAIGASVVDCAYLWAAQRATSC
ncbi:hypothetical protein ABZP36_017457 [Zizania latifolia]